MRPHISFFFFVLGFAKIGTMVDGAGGNTPNDLPTDFNRSNTSFA